MTGTHRIFATAALVLATAFLCVAALNAHMALAKSMPAADSTITAPPAGIQVWFTQTPDVKVSRLTLTGPSGAVKLNAPEAKDDRSIVATIAGEMADGVYTLAWLSAGDDGHVQKGDFTFTLKRRAE